MATFSYAKDLADLAAANSTYRPQLLVILSKIGQPRYAHFIAKFADSESEELRLAVACALGVIKQQSGIPVLGLLLEDANSSVRWAASTSLVGIAGERVVETARLRIHHPSKEIQALAARTLGCLGVTEGLSVLRRLARVAEEPRTRSIANAFLGQLKDHESRPIIVAGLKDKSMLVRTYAIYALGFVGQAGDIPAIEACLFEAKTTAPAPADTEAMELIDETTRESLEQIRSRFAEK